MTLFQLQTKILIFLQACDFSNMYAPEHLIVNVEDAEQWLDSLDNAGKADEFRCICSFLNFETYHESLVQKFLW